MWLANETIGLIKQKLKQEQRITLPAAGSSMFPFIRKGDLCCFVPCDPLALKRGEVALFYTEKGRLIAHRFQRKEQWAGELKLIFKGDTNLAADEPVIKDRIIGKLAAIERCGHVHLPTSTFASLWGRVISRCPVLSGWLRSYIIKKEDQQT